MIPFEVTVEELKALLDEKKPVQLIDCRRQDEYDLVNLGGTLIEMNEIPKHLDDFDAEAKLIR